MCGETATGFSTTPNNDSGQLDVCLLPREIFWMALEYLTPRDIVRCRRVSRTWNNAFGNPINLIQLMKKLFPLAREIRALRDEGILDNPYQINAKGCEYWRGIFNRVACRYDHLARGKPRSIQKYKLCDDFGDSGEREFFPVQAWENHASHVAQVDCPFSEAFWSYEDGLLVYPSANHHCLFLMDLNSVSGQRVIVPFLITGKVIRRIRLQHRVLVVEWAEPNAFHWLNDSDGVHRHFASSFDVTRSSSPNSSSDNDCSWNVTFRNEWKIMFLGHPLSERDRFFSSHTKTHYAIYIWQPNRSLYTADEDAPIELLTVWDISNPSSYRPSLDPTGRLKETAQDTGPSIIARFGFRKLGFYLVRQRGYPRIQRLEVTDDAQAVEITESILPSTLLSELVAPAEWTPDVHITSIPISGQGPCWRRKTTEVVFPPYRGNSSLHAPPIVTYSDADERDEPWYSVISQATDPEAQVRFCLHFAPSFLPDLEMRLSVRTPSSCITLPLEEFFQLVAKGKVCGDERVLVGENHIRELLVWRFDR